MEEELHTLGIDRLLRRVDDTLQEEVRLLQLVVEEQVSL